MDSILMLVMVTLSGGLFLCTAMKNTRSCQAIVQAGGKAIEDLKSQVAILQKELQSLREIKYQVLALQKEQKSMKELRAKEVEATQTDLATVKSQLKELWRMAVLRCPHGYDLHKSSCYKIVIDYLNWASAVQNCSSDGAHLVSIESREEQEYILDYIKKAPDYRRPYWTSGNDRKRHGTWVWEATGKVFSYTNWAIGDPEGNYHCVLMVPGSKYKWRNYGCFVNERFICEKPAITT